MQDLNTFVNDYLAVWNEADSSARRSRLDKSWTADAQYADPMMQGEGRDAIAAMIEGARAQFPGHVFAPSGVPDGHGDFVRFSWTLASADGAPVARGTDVARLDSRGRIAEVIGFLDGAQAA